MNDLAEILASRLEAAGADLAAAMMEIDLRRQAALDAADAAHRAAIEAYRCAAETARIETLESMRARLAGMANHARQFLGEKPAPEPETDPERPAPPPGEEDWRMNLARLAADAGVEPPEAQ